jgi:hypothetical protein
MGASGNSSDARYSKPNYHQAGYHLAGMVKTNESIAAN